MSQVSPIVQNVVVHNGFTCDQRAPIVGRNHPVEQHTMDFHAPVKDGITCMHPSPARTATARHAHMLACVCTRMPQLDMRACAPARTDDVFLLSRRVCSLETAPPPRDMRACVHQHARMRACENAHAAARHARMCACECTRMLRTDHVFLLSRRVRSLRNSTAAARRRRNLP